MNHPEINPTGQDCVTRIPARDFFFVDEAGFGQVLTQQAGARGILSMGVLGSTRGRAALELDLAHTAMDVDQDEDEPCTGTAFITW